MFKKSLLSTLAVAVTATTLGLSSAVDAKPPWSNGNHPGKSGNVNVQANANVNTKARANWDNDRDWDDDRYDRYRRTYNRNRITDVLAAVLGGQTRYGIQPTYLRQQQGLPPGIAKNLQRGKPLPPGIAKKMYNLPPDAYGYFGIDRRYRAGIYGDNLIIATAAGVIADVLFDVF